MKRSSAFRAALTIGLVSVSAFALSSCGEEEINSRTFPNLQACIAAVSADVTKMTVDDCNKAYSEAEKVYQDTSPRYADMKLCEEEHGPKYCVQEKTADGHASFMPMFMGYMMGRSMSNNTSALVSTPLYHNNMGSYSSYDGAAKVSRVGESVSSYKSSYSRPASSVRMPPMTRVMITSRAVGFNSAGRVSFSG